MRESVVLNKYTSDMDEDEIAIESFLSTIVDTTSRLFFNIKSTTLRMFKGFDRSEIRAYRESNPMKLSATLKLSYTDVMKMEVAYPEHMSVTYKDAVTTLFPLFDKPNALVNLLENTSYSFKKIDYGRGSVTENSPLILGMAYTNYRKGNVAQVLPKLFKGKDDREGLTVFSKLFKNMSEVQAVYKTLLTVEARYQEANRASACIDDLNVQTDAFVAAVRSLDLKGNKRLREYVGSISNVLIDVAEQAETFGFLCAEAQRIEHNFVLVLRRIGEKI